MNTRCFKPLCHGSIFVFCILLLSACSQFSSEPVATEEAQTEEFYVAGEGVRLFCKSFGRGEPIVVLHDGPGLDHTYLLPQLEELAETHRVIFYDQRGCGLSDAELTPGSLNLRNYLSDLDAVREAIGAERLTLLGHSWGALLAMYYSFDHPERVERLILVSSAPAQSSWIDAMAEEYYLRTGKYVDQIAALQTSPEFAAGDPATIASYYRYIFRTYMRNEADVERLSLNFTTDSALNGLTVNQMMRDAVLSKPFDLSPQLARLSCPTLIIHGDSDVIPEGAAKQIHKSIPNSSYVLLEQCGHFPYIERSELFFAAVQDFLAD